MNFFPKEGIYRIYPMDTYYFKVQQRCDGRWLSLHNFSTEKEAEECIARKIKSDGLNEELLKKARSFQKQNPPRVVPPYRFL